ncbi:DUF6483 family protein [Wansuia hejianensis]|uniref:Uncharacterized protein n=1 Tax=Wansuia hejianensis TaxID=2763667 RepID=A0A926IGM9_9FIRM|nr:DUF6483 family protein [Wansuia hejianensis]MBC8589752.1 hypothetical protein [Wansuia hejianensis]
MYHQDWLMRKIENIVKIIAKIIFKKDDINYQIINQYKYTKTDFLHEEILKLLNSLKIDEAENLLFDNIEVKNLNYLNVAIDFYDRINKLSDEELEKGNFTRKEIESGIKDILEIFQINMPNF